MSRRDQIRMSEAEQAEFLEQERVVVVASLGPDGWPHLMPLWYVPRADGLWAWTYAKSQKIRNLERDPRCTLQVEAGDAYSELRGVMYKARAVLQRDPDTVLQIGVELAERYSGETLTGDVGEAMRAQAAKRVGLSFEITDTVSWDHRKLGGTY